MIVPGEGPTPCLVMLVGEAPGMHENVTGRPFVGRAGEVLNEALNRASLSRRKFYVTHLVKLRPVDAKGKDRPPTEEEIAQWAATFDEELRVVRPEIIVTLGATSTRRFLPELSSVGGMETVHGMPRKRGQYTIFPVYHPAAGLHAPRTMSDFFWDIKQLGSYLRGETLTASFDGPPPRVLGVDTEGTIKAPWCYTTSDGRFQRFPTTQSPVDKRPVVFHSALHDLQVFRAAKVPMRVDHDTMSMAYKLGTEPKGLKELVYRYFDKVLPKYPDIVREADRRIMGKYLQRAMEMDWPPVAPRKQPVARRLWTLLQKLTMGTAVDLPNGDVDIILAEPEAVAADWADHDLRPQVEAQCGPMPRANLSHVPTSVAVKYAVGDAVDTRDLYAVLMPKIKAQGLERTYQMQMDIVPMVADMETTGLLVDKERLDHAAKTIGQARNTYLELLKEYVGREDFNPGSSPQVAEILAQEGVIISKLTKAGKVSTGKTVLKALSQTNSFAGAVFGFRECDKLVNTFLPAIWNNIQEDGRVHPHYRLTNTETGRLSAHSPNLMAFPTRSDLGKLIRGVFRAAPGRKLIECDLDQIEMRILADESDDPTMIRVIREGVDMHAFSASRMFKVPIEECGKGQKYGKLYRDPCKVAGFRVAYEGGWQGLKETLMAEGSNESDEFYQGLITGWYATFPGVKTYQQRRHNEAHTYGYVRDRWGNIRHVEAVWCPDQQISKKAEREGGNFPIQSGAQGQIQLSMGLMARNTRLIGANAPARPLLQVHDSMMLEVDEDRVDEVKEFVLQCMTDMENYKVPITASAAVGDYWSDLK